ncbi:MAG TPA: hypothetical protein VIU12_21185 [Chryseolinea sp.]
MASTQLNPKILEKLSKKMNLEKSTVRQAISKLKQKNAKCTLNAVAQIYAMANGLTVMQQLSQADKITLPHIEQSKEKIKVVVKPKKQSKGEKIRVLINYDSEDYFIKGHIKELNRAYTYKCYTGAYILSRKIIENLIIDILQKQYPSCESLENKALYWDINQRRFKDFSIIIKNLLDKKDDFGPSKSKAIERLYQLAKKYKEGANDKTHSWYHLVLNATEFDELQLEDMIELIKKIEN